MKLRLALSVAVLLPTFPLGQGATNNSSVKAELTRQYAAYSKAVIARDAEALTGLLAAKFEYGLKKTKPMQRKAFVMMMTNKSYSDIEDTIQIRRIKALPNKRIVDVMERHSFVYRQGPGMNWASHSMERVDTWVRQSDGWKLVKAQMISKMIADGFKPVGKPGK